MSFGTQKSGHIYTFTSGPLSYYMPLHRTVDFVHFEMHLHSSISISLRVLALDSASVRFNAFVNFFFFAYYSNCVNHIQFHVFGHRTTEKGKRTNKRAKRRPNVQRKHVNEQATATKMPSQH